jgi:hypothetical protein
MEIEEGENQEEKLKGLAFPPPPRNSRHRNHHKILALAFYGSALPSSSSSSSSSSRFRSPPEHHRQMNADLYMHIDDPFLFFFLAKALSCGPHTKEMGLWKSAEKKTKLQSS